MIDQEVPGRVLSALPALLGRTPAEEVVVVGWLARALDAAPPPALLATVPLPSGIRPPDVRTACVAVVDHFRAAGVRAVIPVVYAGNAGDLDALPAQTAATVVVLAERAHLSVLDALRVVGGRWWSYECIDPRCCPEEGSAIPTPEENRP